MRAEEPSLPLFPEPVAFAADVQHVAVMQQPVQNCRGDDGVAQKLAPFSEALVGRQDDAAFLIPGRHQGEEGGRRLPVAPFSIPKNQDTI